MSIAVLRIRDFAQGKLPEAEARPLVYLRFMPYEAAGLYSVLAKKVAENLRNQYVAVLLIRSTPPGAEVRSASGLVGATPVEWVVPLGNLDLTLSKGGYIDARRNLELVAPGQHTYDLQLAKRRFYHSKFIYPTVAAGLISAAAFVLENHYYGMYQSLGQADRESRPAVFAENFRNAKNYERIGYAALGAASLGLALCFTF
jgi:PEGA domain